MSNILNNFIEKYQSFFDSNNILVDEFKNEGLDFDEEAEQVDLISENELARIRVFELGRIYIQILNMETEETIVFFDDELDRKEDFEEFLLQNIKKMINY